MNITDETESPYNFTKSFDKNSELSINYFD
jgi:hypothetical protein